MNDIDANTDVPSEEAVALAESIDGALYRLWSSRAPLSFQVGLIAAIADPALQKAREEERGRCESVVNRECWDWITEEKLHTDDIEIYGAKVAQRALIDAAIAIRSRKDSQ